MYTIQDDGPIRKIKVKVEFVFDIDPYEVLEFVDKRDQSVPVLTDSEAAKFMVDNAREYLGPDYNHNDLAALCSLFNEMEYITVPKSIGFHTDYDGVR